MTTLELYRKHKKGEIGRDRFLYEVRRDGNLPWITNITSYDDAVKILKNKGIISESEISENFEVHFSDGIRQAKKFKDLKSAQQFAKQLVATNKNLQHVDIFKGGISSTADPKGLISWWGPGSYFDNVSKKDRSVASKQMSLNEVDANITTDPAVDRTNPYALKREVQKLLSKEKELTNDSYKLALNKAAKKIAGNPQAIKDAMFSNSDSVAKADSKLQTKEVKKNNFVDKDNGMKKMKGQEAHKAMSAPTKENRKGKPKGVKVMPDKGVTGSQKIIKEVAQYIKKKLSENSLYHEFHTGMEVETPHGTGIIKEINGGTLTVECGGQMYDVQMNTVKHFMEKKNEVSEIEDSYGDSEEQNLDIDDRIKVVYGNEFYGMTGTVEDIRNGFVVVSIDGEEGEYSMHMSDVEKIDDEDYEEEEDLYEEESANQTDFQNGDRIKITSELSRYRGNTGEIHDIHDDGTAMVLLDDSKRTAITIDLSHVRKLRSDEMYEAAEEVTAIDSSTGARKSLGIFKAGQGKKMAQDFKSKGATSTQVSTIA